MLEVRTYGFAGKSRLQKAAIAMALVAAGALLLTVGLVLLLGLVAVGTAGALAVLAYRRITGRPLVQPPRLDPHGAVRIVQQRAAPRHGDAADVAGQVRAGNEDFLRALPEADRDDESSPR